MHTRAAAGSGRAMAWARRDTERDVGGLLVGRAAAQVDVEDPQAATVWPRFAEARQWTCVLAPGELLYIPRGWWHHVRALSASFSVSFWFG